MKLLRLGVITTIVFLANASHIVYADDVEILGTTIGAALGGLFGNQLGHGGGQFAATSIGVAAGGLVGNSVGHAIEYDNRYTSSSGVSIQDAVRNKPVSVVRNTYQANYVAPPALSPHDINLGTPNYCQRYSQIVTIAGRAQESYGVACLQADGVWRIQQ